MPWSITVGRFGGTDVKIHITFVLFLAWIAFSAWAREGPRRARQHAVHRPFVPLRRAARVRPHPCRPPLRHRGARRDAAADWRRGEHAAPAERPRQELVVALAGPAVNLTIGALVLVLGSLRPGELAEIENPQPVARWPARRGEPLSRRLQPDPGLSDGRRAGPACAARDAPRRRAATEIAAKVGQAFAIGLGFLGLFGNPLLLFIAIFIYMAAAGEAQMSAAQRGAEGADRRRGDGDALHADRDRRDPRPGGRRAARHRSARVSGCRRVQETCSPYRPRGYSGAVGQHGRDEPASLVMRVGTDGVAPSAPIESVFERLQDPKSAAL